MSDNTFHTKYRPASLAKVIGHEDAVQKLTGFIESGKVPGAFLFTGPSSVGKTTLARAFAADLNERPIEAQVAMGNVLEIDGGSTRTIDEMRELIGKARFRSQLKKRVIIIDEAQQILSNATAAAALLKPIEEAGKTDTIWILCSMDPAKFTTGNGRALANRCEQLNLTAPGIEELTKQGRRIVKGEGLDYISKEALESVVSMSNGEMRTLANLLQGVAAFYHGKKPKNLDSEAITKVLLSSGSKDDVLAVDVLAGALTLQYAQVHKALLDVAEPFPFINKLVFASSFLLSNAVLKGARHSKVWWTPVNKGLVSKLKGADIKLGRYAALNEAVVNLKSEAANFAVPEMELISARMYRFIKEQK